MSFSRIRSAVIQGLDVQTVYVEADLSNGLPSFRMVGYLSAEVKEAEERVRTAIQNSGFLIPPKKTVINLSPGNIRKSGTSFDLPIALCILEALGELKADTLESYMAVGEVALDGNVQSINGVLPIAMEAKKEKVKGFVVPYGNVEEARLVTQLPVIGVRTLKEAIEKIKTKAFETQEIVSDEKYQYNNAGEKVDFSDVSGQLVAKRASEIAVAGRHNLLMVGPPGSGKSMVAKRISTILPSMTSKECMEITKIYSIAGLLNVEHPLITERPFREVHQTATKTSLIGGGHMPKPGEATLASGGVLFLDELTEFHKQVLEVLRGPLEERVVRISRNLGNYVFPADFMLVAAMNPCPCGKYPSYQCNCSPAQIQRYIGKISQPFLDRMDLCIEVPRVVYDDLYQATKKPGESSEDIRKRVERVIDIQRERYQGDGFKYNSEYGIADIEKYCELNREGKRMMRKAFDEMSLTARTYHKILKVARTIADLDESERIEISHLQEAFVYRNIDKKYWGY